MLPDISAYQEAREYDQEAREYDQEAIEYLELRQNIFSLKAKNI